MPNTGVLLSKRPPYRFDEKAGRTCPAGSALAGQEGRGEQPEAGHPDRDHDQPPVLRGRLEDREPDEGRSEAQPESGLGRVVNGQEEPVPSRDGFGRGRQRAESRSQPDQGEQAPDDQADDLTDRHARARSSSETTSWSVVWGKLAYHWPTAMNGSGVSRHTTSSASCDNRFTASAGATGIASTTRAASWPRAHRRAAAAVPPVATPSSTTTATRPETTTGGLPPR